MAIYISTGGYKDLTAEKICEDFLKEGINSIELSGTKYVEGTIEKLSSLKKKINFQIHNYFPPPKTPFVLNLASEDEKISELTLNHIFYALECCNKLNAKFYSFHAGFLCDISVSELGKRVQKKKLQDRSETKKIFLKRVKMISERASELGVNIMIENNVLSRKNLEEFGSNPLLMCEAKECIDIINDCPNNVKLLLDVAHLKVSSKSLGFDPVNFLHDCKNIIGGYHFSDNNGLSDSNEVFNDQSWFWDHIKTDLDYYSIEVYNKDIMQLKSLVNIVKKRIKI